VYGIGPDFGKILTNINKILPIMCIMDTVIHPAVGQVPAPALIGPEVRPASDAAPGVRAPARRIEPPRASHASIRVDGERQRGAPRLPAPVGESPTKGSGRAGSLPAPLEAPGQGGPGHSPHSLYLAQHIAQELLEEGLYINRHPEASAAYRSAASARVTFLGPEAPLDIAV
jgi:hypothetical protein